MCKPIVAATILVGILVVIPGIGQGIYLCKDADGRQVLTDRPLQLENCALMDLSTPPASGGPGRTPVPRGPSPVPSTPHDARGASEKMPGSHLTNALAIPIQRVGNLFLVTVHLVGESGEADARLIVDTGASYTIISYKLALTLGLYSDSRSDLVTLNTVGGPVQAPLTRMKSIQLKEAEVTNSLVVIHDLPDSPDGVEGLLGLTVLQHFQVTLDPVNSILSLQPSLK